MKQNLSPLGMAQELMPQPPAQMSAVYKSGNLRQNKCLHPHLNHAQRRLKSGKRVIGYFRPGFRHGCQKCGLTHIGIAYNTHIGNKLKVEYNTVFFAEPAFSSCFGSLVRRRSKVDIT